MENKLIKLIDGARILGVQRQALYMAVMKKRLPAIQMGNRWFFQMKDLEYYRATKYNRKFSRREGELVFDVDNGVVSPHQAAKILNISAQTVYHWIRKNYISHTKAGAAYVISLNEVRELKNKKDAAQGIFSLRASN